MSNLNLISELIILFHSPAPTKAEEFTQLQGLAVIRESVAHSGRVPLAALSSEILALKHLLGSNHERSVLPQISMGFRLGVAAALASHLPGFPKMVDGLKRDHSNDRKRFRK